MVVPKISSEALAVGLLFLAIIVLSCLVPIQSDTWWLLRAGQEIATTWRIPLHDTYSHTANGLYWPNHEWLSEVAFHAAHRIGGPALLTAMCATAVVTAWWLSWRLLGGSFELRFVLFSLSLPAAATGWAVRPQVFTLLAVALTCHAVLANRFGWLPLIFLVWTNLHGAVAVGLVILAGAIVGELVATRRVPVTLALAACGSAGATLMSPLGWGLWSFIPESMARSRANQLIEWLPPDVSAAMVPFWALALLVTASAVVRRAELDRRRLALVGMALATLALAVQSRRNVPVFLLVGVPAAAALLTAKSLPRERAARGERAGVNGLLLSGASLAAAVFITLVWIRPPGQLGWRPISSEAVAAVSRCGAPLYNTYGTGGVLIWFSPSTPVFIDNRQDPYPTDLLKANYDVETSGNYQALLDRHGIACAAVPSESLLAGRLKMDSAWTRVFTDSQWGVFVRAHPQQDERTPAPER